MKASWYRGRSDSTKKYGAIMFPIWPRGGVPSIAVLCNEADNVTNAADCHGSGKQRCREVPDAVSFGWHQCKRV
ncbi:hypothetical protein KC365_g73 [Hortaea werneckii]|nr:hypothetical protein KC339_g69 [Hortaea werneckii]KAI7245929.1 hypothetical protein KC365_g73 [Hortaea werneckii]